MGRSAASARPSSATTSSRRRSRRSSPSRTRSTSRATPPSRGSWARRRSRRRRSPSPTSGSRAAPPARRARRPRSTSSATRRRAATRGRSRTTAPRPSRSSTSSRRSACSDRGDPRLPRAPRRRAPEGLARRALQGGLARRRRHRRRPRLRRRGARAAGGEGRGETRPRPRRPRAPAAGLAARLDAGLNWDLTDIAREDGRLVGKRPALEDSVYVDVGWRGEPRLALFRSGAFDPAESGGGEAEVEEVSVSFEDFSQAAKMLEQAHEERSGPSIEDAEIIVAGGRGLGGPENFKLCEELAEALGGAGAATRAVGEAGRD